MNIVKVTIIPPSKTTIEWDDGTTTLSECKDGDTYDQEKGVLICIAKKYLGGMKEVVEAYNMGNSWLNEFSRVNREEMDKVRDK